MKFISYIRKKSTEKYMQQQFFNAKKYVENSLKNHELTEEQRTRVCYKFRCIVYAYAYILYMNFEKDGIFSETLLCKGQSSPYRASSMYSNFIDEQEEWLKNIIESDKESRQRKE